MISFIYFNSCRGREVVVYVKCFYEHLAYSANYATVCLVVNIEIICIFPRTVVVSNLVSELLRIGICMLRFGSNPQLKHSCFAELALSGGTEPRKKFSRVKKIKLDMVSERLFFGHPSKEAKGNNVNVCFKIR